MQAMLRLEIKNFAGDDWDHLTKPLSGLNLMQSWPYAEAKAKSGPWRIERGLFWNEDDIVGAFQAMVRPLVAGLPGGLVWINRGPLLKKGTGKTDARLFQDMMAALFDHYAKSRSMYLRLAPPQGCENISPPSCMKETPTPGWASAGLDLNQPQETLRAGLAQKWRNCLNKAERLGVEVRSGGDLLAPFLEQYRLMLQSYGFQTTVTPQLLKDLYEASPVGGKPEVFMAYLDNAPLAFVFVAVYGGDCEYLAGGTTQEGRRINAGQKTLFHSALSMKEKGFQRFDLGGMDEDLTPSGIYHFKNGLGGAPYRLGNELESTGGGLLARLVRWRVGRARAQDQAP
jgi:hypothetical protein